jgi:inner membrane protein
MPAPQTKGSKVDLTYQPAKPASRFPSGLDRKNQERYYENNPLYYTETYMPTFIGHAVTGIAVSTFTPQTARLKKFALLCAACAMAPDLDVVTFRFGIPYSSWLGHRGFSHSLLFAGMIASMAYLTVWRSTPNAQKGFTLWSCFFTSAALHGLLDAMTNGGLGIAFFSPFDTSRHFLPWRPIAVSPLSITRFFSHGGSAALCSEFAWVMVPSIVAIVVARLLRRSRKGPGICATLPGPDQPA